MKRRSFEYGGLAAAIVVAAGLATTGVQAQSDAAATTSVASPRMPDGKPDLSGTWKDDVTLGRRERQSLYLQRDGVAIERFPSRRCAPTQKGTEGQGCFEETNETTDFEFTTRLNANRPLYKPEYWDKVQELDYNTNTKDPLFSCMPLGVPRMGPPAQIVQTPRYVIFFYTEPNASANQFRIIPLDGRGHDPVRAQDISYFGDAVGHWEGDTLVVDAVGFDDSTWLASGIFGGGGGYFHSYQMRVTERLRREGNILHYQAIIDDPVVLLQPWAMNARDMSLNADPEAYVQEGNQCAQVDPGIVVTKVRH